MRQFVRSLDPWISQERIEAHRPDGGDDVPTILTYLHNIALCVVL